MPGSASTASRNSHSSVVRRTMSTARSSSPGCGSPRLLRAGTVTHPTSRSASQHVGEVTAHLDDEAGQEAVGLVDLRGAAAVGDERLLGVSGRGQRIAFEQDHPCPARPSASAVLSPPIPAPTTTTASVHRCPRSRSPSSPDSWQRLLPKIDHTLRLIALPSLAEPARPWPVGRALPPTTGGPNGAACCSTPRFDLLGTRGLVGYDGAGGVPAARPQPAVLLRELRRPRRARRGRLRPSRRRVAGRRSSSALDAAPPDLPSQIGAAVETAVGFVDDDRRRARVLYVEALGNEALNRRRISAGYDITSFISTMPAGGAAGAPRASGSARPRPPCWSAGSARC